MGQWDPEWIQAGIAFVALWAAIIAGIVSWQAYQASYRPIVRVVPLSEGDDSGGNDLLRDRLVLKNIGRGPAISIVIVQGRGSSEDSLIGEVDALEPLGETYGPDFEESARVGRVQVHLDDSLVDDERYRVIYVDIGGKWHETDFKVLGGARLEIRVGQSRHQEEIPNWVRERAQIVTGNPW
jgi:hypothetical protein